VQDPAHDLAVARLGQAGGELQCVGRRDRADFAADPVAQILSQRCSTAASNAYISARLTMWTGWRLTFELSRAEQSYAIDRIEGNP
jgi:hypothetical protein